MILFVYVAAVLIVLYLARKPLRRWGWKLTKKAVKGSVRWLAGQRSTLGPLYIGIGVVLTVAAAKLYLPGAWWLFAIAALLAIALITALVKSARDRYWMGADAAAFGGYGAWEMLHQAITTAGITMGLGIAVLANLPKIGTTYASGEARVLRRLQQDRWRPMVEAREMTGLKRGHIRRTPMGLDVIVTLNGKLTVEKLVGKVRDLETGLGTRRGAIRVEPHEMANKALVRIMTRNPLKKAVPWEAPAAPVSITTPARLSMNAFGEWTTVDLQQRILVVGASGSGKSSVQRVLSAPVILAADADLEVWDLKQGTESQHYEGKAVLRVTTVEECKARIRELIDIELPRRARIMQQLKTSTWPTSPKYRDRVVMVDEGAALIRGLDEDELEDLFTFLEQARAYGIYLWWATQFPKGTNLPTELRSQMSAIVGLKMRRGSESRVVFEELTKEGWTPHRLPGKGWLMLLDDDHDEPTESRAAWLDESQFRTLERPAAPAAADAPVPAAPPMPTAAPLIPTQAAPVDEPVNLGKAPAAANTQEQTEETPAAAELPVPDAVLAALQDAPADGMSASELQLATGRGKTQVYAAIQQLKDDGAIVRIAHGRYGVATRQNEATA